MAGIAKKAASWTAAVVLSAALVPPAAAGPPLKAPLASGEMVQPFDAEGLDGVMKHVDFPKGSATVVLFFLSGCPTCHKMIPEWNRAFQRKPPGLQVIGVLMDQEPPNFFVTTPIAFPVVRSPGRDFLLKLKVSRAPLMLRVGQGGKVEDVAMGYTDPIRVGEVFRP